MTNSRHICTLDTLRGMDNGNLSRGPTKGVELFKHMIVQINCIKLGRPVYFFLVINILGNMAPVYFFLAIDQKFPFNFNYYMCLSIVKPPRYPLTKNDHNLIFLHSCTQT